MSYASIGLGEIGTAIAQAFTREGIEVADKAEVVVLAVPLRARATRGDALSGGHLFATPMWQHDANSGIMLRRSRAQIQRPSTPSSPLRPYTRPP